jgi:O-antigen/teichoic acid export membrane protein
MMLMRNAVNARWHSGSTLRSVFKLMTGNIVASLITMVTSILVARWTFPSEMGIWNTALLVSIYTPTLQMGVFNGLNRELPYLIGSGNKDGALRMAQAAVAWSRFLVVLSIACGLIAVLWFWHDHKQTLVYTALALTAIIASSWPTQYLTTTYRTNNEFGRLARNTVIVAFFGVVLVGFVWWFHFEGLLLRAGLMGIFGVLALYWRRPLPVHSRWGWKELFHLAKIGAPIWLVGQLGALFTSLDRLSLVHATQELGYFTIAIQVGTFVRAIPGAFSTVFYPQMAHRYGQTHCAMDIWHIARKAAIGASAAGLFAGLCGWFMLPTFVRIMLPKYVPGISAARVSAFLGVAMGLYLFDNIYNVIRRQDLYVLNWLVGCSTFACVWFSLSHWSRLSAPVASATSMLTATFIMALSSAFVSRFACIQHDRALQVTNATPAH